MVGQYQLRRRHRVELPRRPCSGARAARGVEPEDQETLTGGCGKQAGGIKKRAALVGPPRVRTTGVEARTLTCERPSCSQGKEGRVKRNISSASPPHGGGL